MNTIESIIEERVFGRADRMHLVQIQPVPPLGEQFTDLELVQLIA